VQAAEQLARLLASMSLFALPYLKGLTFTCTI